MREAATLLSPAEAARRILDAVEPLDSETIPLGDAPGRVLASDVRSPIDVPPWDNAAMDGYAVRSSDLDEGARTDTPVTLPVVDHVPAGGKSQVTLGAGQSVRVFTGAPIPAGPDTVVRQEDATSIGGASVRIERYRDLRRNVRRRGEDIPAQATVLRRHAELGPAQVGALAAVACDMVAVVRRPTIAVMASGDEIADLDQKPAILRGERIASSNSYALAAAIELAGGTVRHLGIAKDDPGDIATRLARAAGADLVVTTAGMSVGQHDHLRELLLAQADAAGFWRLRARPGAPVGFGRVAGVPWIGLPGNPVSSLVTFELFVRPALRKLAGHSAWFRRPVLVEAAEQMATPGRLQHFLRVTLEPTGDVPLARLTGPQGSGILSSMVLADALLIVPEDLESVEPGTRLPALPFTGWAYLTAAPY